VADEPIATQPWCCLFCRMHTGVGLFRAPVCHICRDQLQDFIWASGIRGALAAVGLLSGVQVLVEEILVCGALVLVEHRLPSIFEGLVRNA